MRVVCWNVAGLRGRVRKGEIDWLSDYEVICLQETKALESEVVLPSKIKEDFKYRLWESCTGEGGQRKGLSGTAIWSKIRPLRKLEKPEEDLEGRVTGAEFESFNLVTVYTPNSQNPTSMRFVYRVNKWDTLFREYIERLNKIKPTIVCGDFNVARTDDDVYNPDKFRNSAAGFMNAERVGLELLLSTGYRDAFRHCFPDRKDAYTFWDQKIPVLKQKNKGWRIDYFFVPDRWRKRIVNCDHLTDVKGSDHCPILLEIRIPKRKIVVVD